MLATILDPVLSPILRLPLAAGIIIISLVVSVLVTVVYKYTTDQNLMKRLKTEMKDLQKEMKQLKDKPQEAMKVQKKAMETNMKYMMQSFKSTIFTILPLFLIFGWMQANIAYEPIHPGEEFTVTALMDKEALGNVTLVVPEGITLVSEADKEIIDKSVTWTLSGTEGLHTLEFRYKNDVKYKDVLLSEVKYSPVIQTYKSSSFKSVTLGNEKSKPLGFINIGISWLWVYIISSIIFSMGLRKIMKIY